MSQPNQPEVERLENLWGGEFGNAYLERNREAGGERGPFWAQLLTEFPVGRVLEVGCNRGANLAWIAPHVPPRQIYGIDVNENALAEGRQLASTTNFLWGRGQIVRRPARPWPPRGCRVPGGRGSDGGSR